MGPIQHSASEPSYLHDPNHSIGLASFQERSLCPGVTAFSEESSGAACIALEQGREMILHRPAADPPDLQDSNDLELKLGEQEGKDESHNQAFPGIFSETHEALNALKSQVGDFQSGLQAMRARHATEASEQKLALASVLA